MKLRLELAPELPCLLCGPVRIQQVLVDRVRNAFGAVSATQAANPVVVIAIRPDASGAWEFAVTDNGEGIRNERLPHRIDASFGTRDEGMGLGRAISRTIVEAHQGRIEALSSSRGGGSTFRYVLPAAVDP